MPAPYVPGFATCLVGAALGAAVGALLQALLPVLRRPKAANADQPTELNATTPEHAQETSNTGPAATGPAADDISSVEIEPTPGLPETALPEKALPEKALLCDRTSRYGESAIAPTIYADVAFGMTLIGIVLGPQAVISVSALLLPVVVAYGTTRAVRRIPVTLFLFAIAFGHQLFWVQIHRLFAFGG